MNPPKTPKNIQSPQTTKRLLRKKEVDKTADTNIFPDEVYRKSYSQENPNTTAEGVKMGGTSRITPKVVPEKVLNPSPDTLRGDDEEILKEVLNGEFKDTLSSTAYEKIVRKAIALTKKKYKHTDEDLALEYSYGWDKAEQRILEMIDKWWHHTMQISSSSTRLEELKKEIMKDG